MVESHVKQIVLEAIQNVLSESANSIHVHSNYEDGHGPVKVFVHDTNTGDKKTFKVEHGYAEDVEDGTFSQPEHNKFVKYLVDGHSLSKPQAKAVADHFYGITSDEGHNDIGHTFNQSTKSGYTVHSIHGASTK